MKILISVLAGSAILLVLAGCGGAPSPAVPGLTSGGSSSSSPDRAVKLKSAADCIRSHGAPTYQDPVVGSNGQVYTDARSIQDLSDSQMTVIEGACGALIASAGFSPADEAPATPALVAAGVNAARCLRTNGLPDYRDPTSSTPFTPGHGFSVASDEIPNSGALGKKDPTFQRAMTACRTLLDAEVKASELASLAHG
jgi:hypothetical protein